MSKKRTMIQQIKQKIPSSDSDYETHTDKNNNLGYYSGLSDKNQNLNYSQLSDSRLTNDQVHSLITRIHEYYERLHDHDQDKFFNSQLYLDAGENHNIGRDLNLNSGKLVYSPKYKNFATFK